MDQSTHPMHDSEFDIAAQKKAPEMKPLVPFKDIPCLYCSEVETVHINLATMAFSCSGCDNEWNVKDVHTTIQIWLRVLTWISKIPDAE